MRPPARHTGAILLLLALVGAGVYWVGLGLGALNRTEGHRAIPAWHALQGGDWWPTTLFGTVYVNKPPLMSWAVAATSTVFGTNAFAARTVSALSMSILMILSGVFAARWFAPRDGGDPRGASRIRVAAFASGAVGVVAVAGFWAIGRAADIEALLCLCVGLAVYPFIDTALDPGRENRARLAMGLLAVIGVVGAVLAKGPAIAPTLGGVVLAGLVVAGTGRRKAFGLWAGVVLVASGVVIGALAWWMYGAIERAADPNTQQQAVGEFLWSPDKIGRILMLPANAIVLALPGALALLFPWGPDARREDEEATRDGRPSVFRPARALALATLLAIGVATIAGLHNPRYGLPTFVLVAPLVAYVVCGVVAGRFNAKRTRIARAMMAGHPAVWALLFVIGGVIYGTIVRPEGRNGGLMAGVVVAEQIIDDAGTRDAAIEPVELWADNAIYDKPEVFWYAAEVGADRGRPIRVRWMRTRLAELSEPGAWPAGPIYVVLDPAEASDLAAQGLELGPGIELETLERPYSFYILRPEAAPRRR